MKEIYYGPASSMTNQDTKETKNPNILVVDYEAPNVKLLKDFFKERGYIAVGIQHPEYLGDILSNNHFDLVVLEVSAPVPDYASTAEKEAMEYGRTAGLYQLTKLRCEFPDMTIPPVIILSVIRKRLLDLTVTSYAELGITCVLEKPCYANDLEAAIGRVSPCNQRLTACAC